MNKVGDYMSTTLYSTSPDKFAHEAVDDMYKNKVSALLVKDKDAYVGIFTKTDWMILALKGECDPKSVKVSTLMTTIKSTIDKGETIARASALIEERKVRHLPVTDNGTIVGMFSVKDMEKYYLDLHKQTEF
ncbi:MAG: CBS domain-containing protein [Candidatus Nitrohelix vancouverensis]|uniref:CBS domain-containing protein n=1 Tax=Candidatus Nitrohelix vancouverensis TaxID=2705534 RepID=A0A7T0G312_9BACT|nr:MAG: CBS domain-containing protein [Candidatus Nitrohelix vancouverensis]